MPRRIGLPSLYLAAAAATAVSTAIPPAMAPASGLAARPPVNEPTRPYIVTVRDRAEVRLARDLAGEMRRLSTAALSGFATSTELGEPSADPRVLTIEPDREIHPIPVITDRDTLPGGMRGAAIVDSGGAHDRTGESWRTRTFLPGLRVSGRTGNLRVSDGLGERLWWAFDATGRTREDRGGQGTRVARSGVFVVFATGPSPCRLSPTGETYSARSSRLAGAAARYLELHPGANPSVPASWRKCAATRDTIRQNPSRALRAGRP